MDGIRMMMHSQNPISQKSRLTLARLEGLTVCPLACHVCPHTWCTDDEAWVSKCAKKAADSKLKCGKKSWQKRCAATCDACDACENDKGAAYCLKKWGQGKCTKKAVAKKCQLTCGACDA